MGVSSKGETPIFNERFFIMLIYQDGNYTIHEKTKTVYHYNKESDHWWSEDIKQEGFEVSGGRFFTDYFKTLKAAKEEIRIRRKLNKLIFEEQLRKETNHVNL